MKSDFLRIIFDIIVLIVLVVLIYFIIMAFIGVSLGKELEYSEYLNTIAHDINNGGNSEVFISNYDYNYVFVLTNNNGWKLQLYQCLPPNSDVGFLSVKIAYWNVSTTNDGNIVFAPSLAFCKLLKQRSLYIEQINISIQGLNDNAGLLVLNFNNDNNNLNNLQITMTLIDDFFSGYPFLAILNDTTITCSDSGCTYTSSSTGESGNIYCAPNPNINPSNNNLQYNPSDCVELSGFPQNPQLTLSNFVGEITSSEAIYSLYQTFQMNFPLLYFAGSLPPTAMYIYISSNTKSGIANISIYIGETVSS
ncbi:hypothetical protein DDW05_01420 [Candidatus Nanobsidianus stetteri]|uniref:Uncharacterized protein n=1 Tax=Nanobsidianus stetteri TaxID=1294122 RepID=A0A2T9WU04_NANST|nr:hypothetical protein DDW05_01420 [Candidatus Nanobsidianus stetteri]